MDTLLRGGGKLPIGSYTRECMQQDRTTRSARADYELGILVSPHGVFMLPKKMSNLMAMRAVARKSFSRGNNDQ
jgi:hypothetical protein